GWYKDNLKEGIWLQYNEKGITVLRETYKNGNLVKSEEIKQTK
ncbi:MAG: toxin-antitoxin system YwqK family antitoxin, partial [Bacteroidetes bacterium]|nr:toxin-antitoxin system YwqK family antitoxin [Bacteroidota bacterium]